ncbi:hypothetical protein GCM10010353_69500 [Streptomyces chryseus]|nr:hypothetical protein GCM10010353_69500 [Streptomyces chryseus]
MENGGKTSGGDTLRNLTPVGPKAASYEMGPPVGEMGGPVRGALRQRLTLLRPSGGFPSTSS